MKSNPLFGAVLASLIACNTASAADVMAQEDMMPKVAGNWAGGYIGMYGEGAIVHHKFTEGAGLGSQTTDYNTFGGGVFGGMNWQRGNFVYGVDANVGYDEHTETVTGVPGPGTMTTKLGWQGAIKGRVGKDMGSILPFISGGVAFANLDTFWPAGSAARSATLYGGTVGVGIDYKIKENLFARAAYDFTLYDTATMNYCGGGCVMNHDISTHSFKLGIGLRF